MIGVRVLEEFRFCGLRRIETVKLVEKCMHSLMCSAHDIDVYDLMHIAHGDCAS